MKLVVVLMHTLDKCQSEGFRTRDGHFLETVSEIFPECELVIVDRPVTLAERLLRRRPAPQADMRWRYIRLNSHAFLRPLLMQSRWWGEAFNPKNIEGKSLNRVSDEINSANLVVTFAPTSAKLLSGSSRVHVDLLDDWTIHTVLGQIPGIADSYSDLFRCSQSVTANSEGTVALARRFDVNATLVPNGVDSHRIQHRALEESQAGAEILRDFPRPWFIYAGKIQERVDIDLCVSLAAETEGTVVMAGPILSPDWVAGAQKVSNLRFLGNIEYDLLPGLVCHADVALIPHRVGEGEVGGDPIKVYEYGALGLRTLSTPIIGHQRFNSIAMVVERDRFVEEALALGLDGRSISERIENSELPKEWTWLERFQVLLKVAGWPNGN